MIIYLTSYPRSGNTFCRQLIKYYLDRISASIYLEASALVHFEGEENFRLDADRRFRVFFHDQEHPYRVLINGCGTLLTTEFRRELAQSDEIFFIKTHEPPFEAYFDREHVIRIVRHPGAALWSYYRYIVEIERQPVTVEGVISGQSAMIEWSKYTEAWLNAETGLAEKCFKIKYEELVRGEESLIAKIQAWTHLPLKNPLGTFPKFESWHQQSPEFYRRAEIDEWKQKLTPEEIMLLYEQHADAMAKEAYSFDFAPPPNSVDYDTRIHLARLGMVDAESIPKVPNAGQIIETGHLRYQIMFNGVKVPADSYYGPWYSELIRQCRGHHEPQEEYVFYHIVNKAPEGATMMELGSFWAFYSTWFLTHVKNSRAILVEPLPENVVVSLATLSLNNCKASVELGAVGERPASFESIHLGGTQRPNYVIPLLGVDELMAAHSVEHLYVLHSDIQGAEVKMLESATAALENQRIDYVVISTHSNEIHHICLEKLRAFNYHVIAEHDIFESYTYDGLIVACSDQLQDTGILEIHKRSPVEWTWEDAANAWADKEIHLEKHRQMLLRSELGTSYEQLHEDFTQLLEENQSLVREHQALEQEIEKHRQMLQSNDLRTSYEQLHEGYAQLLEENQALEQQTAHLRSRKIVRFMQLIGRPLL